VTPKELAEREGKPIAIRWIDAAIAELGRRESRLLQCALATSFSVPDTVVADGDVVEAIVDTFVRCRDVLVRSDRYFVGVTEGSARTIFPPSAHADIPPAYAIFEEAIYFTPRFEPFDSASMRGFGPLCRAAMVLHESVHVIDPLSGAPNVHISEWDEPGFSAQTIEESLHNPSAYASFAAHVHEGALDWPRSARYGAGRRAD
jgi:hypothetical protein